MIGNHFILDIYDCQEEQISHVENVRPLLHNIIEILNLSKVNESYKQFDPVGVTGVILLEESHLSIHTWPEKQFAAMDIFSCKPFNSEEIITIVAEHLGTQKIKTKNIVRGGEE